MTKKQTAIFAAVRDVIRQLQTLTHDELRDLADMLTANAASDGRYLPHRHGLPPINPYDGHALILKGGWQYRDKPPLFTAPARLELQEAYGSAVDLTAEGAALVVDVARLLQRALAPIGERKQTADGDPLAGGNLQAKIIHRKIVDLFTGEIEIKAFGPYLYYRYFASGGNADRRGSRVKNKYIGRQMLAERFDATPVGSAERRELERRIIEAFKAGTLDILMQDLGLAYTLPNKPPTIDEDAPPEPDNCATGVSMPDAMPSPSIHDLLDRMANAGKTRPAPAFLPDYQPAPSRRIPRPIELTEERRDVLAAYAAGLNYAADYRDGIQKRKVARRLVDAGLLAEVTGSPDHRKHRWKLTQAGLNLVRADEDLQRRITQRLTDRPHLIRSILHNT